MFKSAANKVVLTRPVAQARSRDWRDEATCRGHDPDLFFPEGTAGPALRQVEDSKRICQTCPVRTPCLRFALRHALGFGIWGGVTAEERRLMRHTMT